MNFKTWIENYKLFNRGSKTPASDETIRTNMQPQIDSKQPIKKPKKFDLKN